MPSLGTLRILGLVPLGCPTMDAGKHCWLPIPDILLVFPQVQAPSLGSLTCLGVQGG